MSRLELQKNIEAKRKKLMENFDNVLKSTSEVKVTFIYLIYKIILKNECNFKIVAILSDTDMGY